MLSLKSLRTVNISVSGILGSESIKSDQVQVLVQSTQNRKKPEKLSPYTHRDIQIGSSTIDFCDLKKRYDHLKVLPNCTLSFEDVKMILGQDVYRLIHPIDYKQGGEDDPWAVLTQLGWTVSGPLPRDVTQKLSPSAYLAQVNEQQSEKSKDSGK